MELINNGIIKVILGINNSSNLHKDKIFYKNNKFKTIIWLLKSILLVFL